MVSGPWSYGRAYGGDIGFGQGRGERGGGWVAIVGQRGMHGSGAVLTGSAGMICFQKRSPSGALLAHDPMMCLPRHVAGSPTAERAARGRQD
jgi:hypothetical protein